MSQRRRKPSTRGVTDAARLLRAMEDIGAAFAQVNRNGSMALTAVALNEAEVSGIQAAIEGLRQELALSRETIRCARNLAAALRMSDAASLTGQVGNGTITIVLKRGDVIRGPHA
jgi:hypothetical protein